MQIEALDGDRGLLEEAAKLRSGGGISDGSQRATKASLLRRRIRPWARLTGIPNAWTLDRLMQLDRCSWPRLPPGVGQSMSWP